MSTDKAADPLVEGPAVAVSRFAPQTGGGCDSSRIANLLPSAQLSAPPVCSSPVTSTCVLRSFRREDMSAVLSMGTNPRVCKWLKYARFPQPYSGTIICVAAHSNCHNPVPFQQRCNMLHFDVGYAERDARVWLEEAAIPSIDSATPPLYLAIADPTTDVCLGCIALEPKKDIEHHTLEIAYWLDEPHWGRKVISHAIGGIIKLGMERFSYVQRIEAGILSRCVGSLNGKFIACWML